MSTTKTLSRSERIEALLSRQAKIKHQVVRRFTKRPHAEIVAAQERMKTGADGPRSAAWDLNARNMSAHARIKRLEAMRSN